MKNNSHTKYVLITLVLIVWGLIIYKIVKGLSDDSPALPTTKPTEMVRVDTATGYFLTTDPYADPFKSKVERQKIDYSFSSAAPSMNASGLAGPSLNNNGSPPANSHNGYQQLPSKPVEPPPSITYKGYIYNPQTRKKTAIITYNGKPMVVGIADKIDEKTKILSIDEQQLTFSFSGRRLVVGLGG